MNLLKLFPNCIVVRGAGRNIICDLQRNTYVPVPHSLVNLFDHNWTINVKEITGQLDADDRNIFDEYIALLHRHDFVFNCSREEQANFPALSMDWDFPAHISNLIVELGPETEDDLTQQLLEQLASIQCRYLELRSYQERTLAYWQSFLSRLKKTGVKSIDIITRLEDDDDTGQALTAWVADNKIIRNFVIHSCNNNRILQKASNGAGNVVTVAQVIDSSLHCGAIHAAYFSINVETFTESQHYNTCLNRKLSIDAEGHIKNCPGMTKSYGNIRDTKLLDVVNMAGFRSLWFIKKDEINKCKDCEFRHICTDCRAYLDDPDDLYAAPLKCGYNPYTCEWEDWSNHELKQRAMEHYGLHELRTIR